VASTCRRAALTVALFAAMFLGTASLLFDGCQGSNRGPSDGRPDWDRIAFALQLVRDEYGEQMEVGDVSGVAALATVLDSAVAALGAPTNETRPVATALGELRAGILGHLPPRTVSKTCARLLSDLAKAGRLTRRPTTLPDLRRGAATYVVACAPCHGPPNGPLPPAAAHMLPPPTKPNATLQTPYEIFNRITYGGAGTAMPSFAETLSERARWDIAFYLFADLWPPCTPRPLPTLSAGDLAYLSDRDLWQKYGWGAAPCLRRNFR
jgi:mono/diheme cytochrome c family protein